MAKKSWLEANQNLAIVIVAIAFLYWIISTNGLPSYGGYWGWGGGVAPQVPLDPPTILLTYNVQQSILPSPICVGGTITGTITTNIPNGLCTIFANTGAGFVALANVNLNAGGNFTMTQRMDAIGTAVARSICCDAQGNCRISNDSTLVVTDAVPPCPALPPADSDGDGFSDAEEEAADTNPYDPTDYPHALNCPEFCYSKGFVEGRQVISASQCIGTEVFETQGSLNCCCQPYYEEPTTNTCEGVFVPDGTGDAGGYCAQLHCLSVGHCCDNYWNYFSSKMMCGCVNTFWCQANFAYAINPAQCSCPPYTWYNDLHDGTFMCVPLQG